MRSTDMAWAVVSCLACLPCVAIGAAPPASPAVVGAVFDDGRLYVLKREAPVKNAVIPIPLGDADSRESLLELPIGGDDTTWSLHSSGDHLFLSGWSSFFGATVGAYPHSVFTRGKGSFPRDWRRGFSLCPISNFALRVPGNRFIGVDINFDASRDARHAFALGPGGRLHLFLSWKGKIKAWEGTLPDVIERRGRGIRWDGGIHSEERLADPPAKCEVDTTVREAFLAYRDAWNFYFVTASGQVHRLPRRGKPDRTSVLWADPDRPVRLVINDAGSGRTFAFALRRPGVDPKGKPDVFFLLEPRPEPKATEAPALSPMSSGWRTGVAKQFADFLIREKILKR